MQFYATVSLISGLAVVLVIVVTLVLGRRPAREKVQSPPTNDSVEVSGNLGANEDEGTSGEGLHPALVAGSPGMKKCPYCGGEILAEAVKCKHCREFLTQSETTDAATSNCSVSDASSVRRPHNSLLSARLFILPLVGVAAVFAGWESIKVVNAYHALHEAGQEEMKAGARLLKATDQEAYSIREMGLDEYARKVNAGASSQDSTGKSADLKAQFQRQRQFFQLKLLRLGQGSWRVFRRTRLSCPALP